MEVGFTSIVKRKWSAWDWAEGCYLIKYNFLVILSFKKWWILVAQFYRLQEFFFIHKNVSFSLCSPLQISFCLFPPLHFHCHCSFDWLHTLTQDCWVIVWSFFHQHLAGKCLLRLNSFSLFYSNFASMLRQLWLRKMLDAVINKNRMKSFGTVTVFTIYSVPEPFYWYLIDHKVVICTTSL